MTWLSWFLPRTVAEFHTSYNQDILVVEKNNSMSLIVNGIQQTGRYVEVLFARALRRFISWYPNPVKNILVIGVGGGAVIRQLHTLYPKAHITAVDIDGVIISIAKKYFTMPDSRICKCIVSDAKVYLKAPKKSLFDLILVDIYIGNDVPDFVTEERFLKSIKNNLVHGGRFILNYFSYFNQPQKSLLLLAKLKKIFYHVTIMDILRNKVYFAVSVLK